MKHVLPRLGRGTFADSGVASAPVTVKVAGDVTGEQSLVASPKNLLHHRKISYKITAHNCYWYGLTSGP